MLIFPVVINDSKPCPLELVDTSPFHTNKIRNNHPATVSKAFCSSRIRRNIDMRLLASFPLS